MVWGTRFDDGVKVQYWIARNDPYDPEVHIHNPPAADLPITDEILLYDENMGIRRGSGGGRGRFGGVDSPWRDRWETVKNIAFGQGGYRKVTCLQPPDKSTNGRQKVVWSNALRKDAGGVMGKAINGTGSLSASDYVRHVNSEWSKTVFAISNPDDYEWCHLWGHGLGGDETPENLVAGTHACNTEQLEIESWLRDKAARRTYLHIEVRAQIAKNGPPYHLAEMIEYKVYAAGESDPGGLLYTKCINARRPNEPSKEERRRTWDELDRAFQLYNRKNV